MDTVVLAAIAGVAVVALLVIVRPIRVVQPYERMVVFRLGQARAEWVREPGLRFLIPIIWQEFIERWGGKVTTVEIHEIVPLRKAPEAERDAPDRAAATPAMPTS